MEKNNLKFAFFGTPDVASKTLEILKNHGFLPTVVVTAEDKPLGRKQIITPPPVKTWCIENGVKYLQPENGGKRLDLFEFLRSNLKEPFDLSIVVAYGKILPQELISLPRLGTINIHYSLLPKYRGASPVQSALLAGDTMTGVSIQQMVHKLDAGPIVVFEELKIKEHEKTPELLERLIKIGGELLVNTLPNLMESKIQKKEQDESQATLCKKINKEDGLVNLEKDSSKDIYNKFRAFYDWPGIYFMRDKKRIKITEATFENDPFDSTRGKKFQILKVIPEGKKEMSYSVWFNTLK